MYHTRGDRTRKRYLRIRHILRFVWKTILLLVFFRTSCDLGKIPETQTQNGELKKMNLPLVVHVVDRKAIGEK